MLLSELRVSVYRQLAACLQQCSHGDGNDPGEPWWVVMAETCTDLDITRQEEMDIGKVYIPHFTISIKFFKFTHVLSFYFKHMSQHDMTISVTNYLFSLIVVFDSGIITCIPHQLWIRD